MIFYEELSKGGLSGRGE